MLAHYFTLIINKHFNFCCFRALAYTTLDRLCAVFLYNIHSFFFVFQLNSGPLSDFLKARSECVSHSPVGLRALVCPSMRRAPAETSETELLQRVYYYKPPPATARAA